MRISNEGKNGKELHLSTMNIFNVTRLLACLLCGFEVEINAKTRIRISRERERYREIRRRSHRRDLVSSKIEN